MSITLDLPEHITEADARLELAIQLYRIGKLPPGRAATLAGMERGEFQRVLKDRKVPFPITEEELVKDIENALRRSSEPPLSARAEPQAEGPAACPAS